jgi:DNA-binding CsgD family transcriptional regulator
MLLGRDAECARIVDLLDAARLGSGSVLVIRGDPGAGKTSLLRFACEQAGGMQLLRATGIASESEIAFAGLLELVRPLLGDLDALPTARADALRGALGLGAGGERDRFAVGAATLDLLALAAEDRPVLVVVDDMQWLDTASLEAVLFAAHRLADDPVAVVLAQRDGEPVNVATGAARVMAIAGLDRDTTTRLAEATLGTGLTKARAERVYRLTAGNPLAVTELGDLDAIDELVDAPVAVSQALEAAFARRATRLTPEAQAVMVVAATDDSGEYGVVRRAAERLGLPADALAEAEAAGLVRIGDGRIAFQHPLVRSAVYQRAPAGERRAAHRALAESLTGGRHAARRAWHGAAATVEPDEAVAAALEAAAQDARSRAGYAAAALALSRAAALTPDDEARARRELAAADAYWNAGRSPRALELLQAGLVRTADPGLRADIQLLQGRIGFLAGDTDGARVLLLEASARIAPVDEHRAAVLAGAALDCAFCASDHDVSLNAATVAIGRAQADDIARDPRATPWLGAALLLVDRPTDARRSTDRLCAELGVAAATEDDLYGLVSVAMAYGWLCEFRLGRDVAQRALEGAREQGALTVAGYASEALAALHMAVGDFDAAVAAADQTLQIGRETGQPQLVRSGAWYLGDLASSRGERDACLAFLAEARACLPGPISWLGWDSSCCVLGRLHLGLGDPEAAVEALTAGVDLDFPHSFGICTGAFELAEAYTRLERPEAAAETLARVAPRIRQPWGFAALARCRGLLEDDFDDPFHEAIDGFAGLSIAWEEARTRLCYGERLRRAGRRVEAREQLRASLAAFDRMRAGAWSERVRTELRAAGETLPSRRASAVEDLTPQELRVALLAAEGATNREIAARLFLSVKTVEAHLHRAFRKLDIASRDQLVRALEPAIVPAVGEPASA